MNNLKVLKLNTNTNVYLKKTKKFKSIAINIVYKMKYDYKNITAFNVLAKYLGNSSNQYPSIEKFNKHIDDLYGTSFGMKSEFVGNLFTFSIFANYVNPKFVSDNDLHENIIKLLHDCIYNPLINENKFDEELFSICKENCMLDINSLKEYNLSFIISKLKQQLSYKTSSYASSIYGNKNVLNKLNNTNIIDYYNLLLSAPFDIYVSGDFNYKDMICLLKKYYFNKKTIDIKYSPFKLIKTETYNPIIYKKNVNQSKIAIAYKIPILFNDNRHYAFRIARLVLSGTLASKFGKVIREQMGLCYAISSTYSSYYGTFIVTTGVDSKNIKKVIDEVDNQIKQLQNGNVSDEEFQGAKQAILSDMYSIDDSIFGILDMIKTYNSFNKSFDYEDELNNYKKVSKQEVIEVSKLLSFCNYAILDKE